MLNRPSVVKSFYEVTREQSNTLFRTRDLTLYTSMKLDKEKGKRQNILFHRATVVRLLNNVGKSKKVIDTIFTQKSSNESDFVINTIYGFGHFTSL